MNDVTTKGLTEREFKVVGTRPPRPDGVDKVTGRAKFGADLHMANMLAGKVLRSPHAHARINAIDASKALALHGVKAKFDTYTDEERAAIHVRVPLGRIGTVEEVASVVTFLASPAASYVHGVLIDVNGGMFMA